MRKDGIPYVQNPKGFYPPIDYMKLNLQELKKKYIDTCGKSQGLLSICSKCTTPCEYGKRAIQLLSNEVYDEPSIPLYGGKTLIERAKEENMKRRQQREEEKAMIEEKKVEKVSRKKKDPEGWYEEAFASDDPVEYVMTRFNLPKTKAKKKIYSYRYLNGLTDKDYKANQKNNHILDDRNKEEPSTQVKEEVKEEVKDTAGTDSIENKIDNLMKQQEQSKKQMDEYYQAYSKAKERYDELGKKIDVLCSAMDIINE